jgi:hypothetical protein
MFDELKAALNQFEQGAKRLNRSADRSKSKAKATVCSFCGKSSLAAGGMV